MVTISGAVEGLVDEAVFRRLVASASADPGPVYGKNGKDRLLRSVGGYNSAARFSPWLVMVDLNGDAECAPPFRNVHLPRPARYMCFRVAVHEIEAWLMADRERLARFLRIRMAAVPAEPETIRDPKRAMVNLAAMSRSADVCKDMVPRPGSGRTVGPAYSSRLVEFVSDVERGWRPDVASGFADSLARCVRSLKQLITKCR